MTFQEFVDVLRERGLAEQAERQQAVDAHPSKPRVEIEGLTLHSVETFYSVGGCGTASVERRVELSLRLRVQAAPQ